MEMNKGKPFFDVSARATGRLTPNLTESLEEAFGTPGVKGREGELFLIKVFESWDWDVKDHENDKKMQVKGIDLSFRNPSWMNFYTCDVKNNMDEYGCFFVYKDWLYKIKADRVFHVNPDTGWLAWYGVDEMREWYNEEFDRIKLIPRKSPKFIKRSKYDG